MDFPIYLDNNSTTRCDPEVLETMLPYFSGKYGNAASRTHAFGWQAREAVEYAREQVAALIGAEPQEIVFTSGATESDNLALKGIFEMYASKGNHIITCVTEHKAVIDSCRHIERLGGEITYLGVNAEGLINIHELEAAIRPSTILIAIMYANNETGVIQPVREISRIARKHGVLFFSDATQTVGKIPVDVNRDGIDLMAVSAHKMYGPKGIGALYVRRKNPRVRLTAQMDGGGHERDMRSGTLNVPGIAGFGKACALCAAYMKADSLDAGLQKQEGMHVSNDYPDAGAEAGELPGGAYPGAEAGRIASLRNRMEDAFLSIEASSVNGSRIHRLPNVCNISFRYIEGDGLMAALSKELAISSGSACTSASPEPSYVLKAMGVEDATARSSLRFGLGRFTTLEEIDYVIALVHKMVGNLRSISPQWEIYKNRS